MFPIVRYKHAWHPSSCSKQLEAPDEHLGRHVSHNVKVHGSGYATGKEAIPYLVGYNQVKGTYVVWPSKVNTCKWKWWFLPDSKLWHRRWWWSTTWSSFISPTYNTHSDRLYVKPDCDPSWSITSSGSVSRFVDSVVLHTLVCISDNQRGQWMISGKQHWMFATIRDVGMCEFPTMSP